MSVAAMLRAVTAPLAALMLASCAPSGPQFAILSGSENEVLAPLVQEFCTSRGASCTIRYLGSLDIAL